MGSTGGLVVGGALDFHCGSPTLAHCSGTAHAVLQCATSSCSPQTDRGPPEGNANDSQASTGTVLGQEYGLH
jgi:hypothetical protein